MVDGHLRVIKFNWPRLAATKHSDAYGTWYADAMELLLVSKECYLDAQQRRVRVIVGKPVQRCLLTKQPTS